MKSSIFAGALLSLAGLATAYDPLCWERVPLQPPLNWVAGSSLFPGRVISGYNDDYNKWNAETWAAHIVDECEKVGSAGSTHAFSGKQNSGFCRRTLLILKTSNQLWHAQDSLLVWLLLRRWPNNSSRLQ